MHVNVRTLHISPTTNWEVTVKKKTTTKNNMDMIFTMCSIKLLWSRILFMSSFLEHDNFWSRLWRIRVGLMTATSKLKVKEKRRFMSNIRPHSKWYQFLEYREKLLAQTTARQNSKNYFLGLRSLQNWYFTHSVMPIFEN